MSTITGILHNLSKIVLPARPACIAVPQATIYILFTEFKYSFEISKSSNEHFSPSLNLDPIVSLTEVGCSKISFSIKSSYPSFWVEFASQSIFLIALL